MKKNIVPFPQANDIYKVIYYFFKSTSNLIPQYLAFVSFDISDRQVSYYKNAVIYLGLLKKNGDISNEGELLLKSSKSVILRLVVLLILKKDVFSNYYHNRNEEMVIDLIKNKYGLSDITAKRRLNTVKSWVYWCDIVVEYNNY